MVPDKGHHKSCRMPSLPAAPAGSTICRSGSHVWLARIPFVLRGRGGER
jgi:hypothetical protein